MTKITQEQLKSDLKDTFRMYKLFSTDYPNKEDLYSDLFSDLWTDFEKFLDQEKETEYEAGIAQGKKDTSYMRG